MGRRSFAVGDFVKLSRAYFDRLRPELHRFSPAQSYYVHASDDRTVSIYDDHHTLRNMSVRVVYKLDEEDIGHRANSRPLKKYPR